jgi:hypothetical protein
VANNSKTDAEARYAKAQKRAQEATKAQSDADAEAKRVNDNTARLRALRLAKEASDAAEARANPQAKGRRKKAAGAKSIRVEKLNASNDK